MVAEDLTGLVGSCTLMAVAMVFSLHRRLAALTLLCASPALAGGGIYKYVEKDGTIVYTNVAPGGARAAALCAAGSGQGSARFGVIVSP